MISLQSRKGVFNVRKGCLPIDPFEDAKQRMAAFGDDGDIISFKQRKEPGKVLFSLSVSIDPGQVKSLDSILKKGFKERRSVFSLNHVPGGTSKNQSAYLDILTAGILDIEVSVHHRPFLEPEDFQQVSFTSLRYQTMSNETRRTSFIIRQFQRG